MPYQPAPRMVIEESPWATLLQSIPNTLLNLFTLSQQLDWKSEEAQLSRDFQKTQDELSFARQIYVGQKNREEVIKEQLIDIGGLPTQEKRSGTEEIINMTAEGLFGEIKQSESYMDQLQGLRSQQMAGIRDVKSLQDRYSGIIEADKDDAVQDYIISGALEIDPETGDPVGSQEWEKILEKLKTGTKAEKLEYEKFRDHAYISGIEKSLRTVEEGYALQASKEQIDTANLQQEAARTAIDTNDFQLFQAKHEEFENNYAEIVKHQALNFTAQFRYGAYSMMDLVAVGAEDPNQLIDIKEEFAESYPNIAHDAEKFLSGVQNARANEVDPSTFVVQFYSKAYEDYLELDEFKTRLADEGKSLNISYKEMYDNLPLKDPTKLEIDRLTQKVNGFKSLGMYGAGADALNHMYAITKMHDEQQMMRLTADAKEYERVAGYGLELDPIESYYPEQYEFMEPEERVELEKSLAFISASGGPPPPAGDTVDIKSLVSDIEQTELAQQAEQTKYRDISDEYKHALGDLRRSDPSGHTFKTIIDDMYQEGMLQGTNRGAGPQIPEGYHFTEKEMTAIRDRVAERARAWRSGGGGFFGKGPNDAVALLQIYQRFEDAWKEYDPLWQGRKESNQQIMESLGRI